MYLFFDTETTGLPKNWQAPIHDTDNWPRMVQLAWVATDDNGEVLSGQNYIIKPEGFLIPKEASSVHGITTERALTEGIDLHNALQEFSDSLNNSEMLIAHNISFDIKIIGAEFFRKKIENSLDDIDKFCTMQTATDFCRIPHANGRGFKWPKLTELHIKLFDEGFDGAHDALADVKACARCFFELRGRGVI
ncbi:MAG: Exonuclease RNase T and DNA polymerase III [Candidatus Falkowbacteria bacterium GW2011_GWC2_38_22]|uniref:Exonuclease RNase T and DNA polymerase III n=1 Tax=Candidatus Falkowbacteria bacterium GW2011_GWE1_38_31 TaxID=1618638 RepID=A0A0G0MBK1_9BACT|nr:MAG: Exonuclease RNase T and DNA polymerase III [Candidatus Falkowbacteria bacterium GW2011_GWF2_38_1205]KKQ61412.1 MAG: Exonuclease RNase T and DNA polymerase III [Candidatus Falkowbacteria bacterium GW2011_GWC2_38_22]KKQ64004.1 MAG: Exonuclease RNase T and DNA polymerase III [Candidatus Falkowbacteria bacterium GW2011_GWF1_38_22]KKQ66648.1 MAG: Exonuclease RNase T and DNA polymerase III [Candidatus Falkowbacteria bacterium GW2011_GWE2_38_254]KKQ71109.1 MAG: Exonuclease RNase T and DNA poly